jgi:hypothetical protein
MIAGEKRMSLADGGEVAEIIERYDGSVFACHCDNYIHLNENSFRGYPHEGGVPDKNGKTWWLYVRCGRCGYDMAWKHLPQHLIGEVMPPDWKPGERDNTVGWQNRRRE